MSIQVSLENQETLLQALKDVRNDKSEVNWALVSHVDDNPNKIQLEATGTDGFDGLVQRFNTDKVQYALCNIFNLVRVTTKIDLSITVKFVYIHVILLI